MMNRKAHYLNSEVTETQLCRACGQYALPDDLVIAVTAYRPSVENRAETTLPGGFVHVYCLQETLAAIALKQGGTTPLPHEEEFPP